MRDMLTMNYLTQDLTEKFEKVAIEDMVVKPKAISGCAPVSQPPETPSTKGGESIVTIPSDESFPPKIIYIYNDQVVGHSIPFAQLGYDRNIDSVVPMLRMSTNGHITTRYGRPRWVTSNNFPPLLADGTDVSESTSEGNVSSLTGGNGLISVDSTEESSLEPIMLGDECNMFLLKRDASHIETPTCSDAILNFLMSAKKFRFARKRMKRQNNDCVSTKKQCGYYKMN